MGLDVRRDGARRVFGFRSPKPPVAEALRLAHLPERIATIRAHIAEHRPRFVLLQGAGRDPVAALPYLDRSSEIAGIPWEPDAIVRRNGTAFVATWHPTAHGLAIAFWTDFGQRLAQI